MASCSWYGPQSCRTLPEMRGRGDRFSDPPPSSRFRTLEQAHPPGAHTWSSLGNSVPTIRKQRAMDTGHYRAQFLWCYTVQNPSQGMVPSTVVRSSPLMNITKMNPPACPEPVSLGPVRFTVDTNSHNAQTSDPSVWQTFNFFSSLRHNLLLNGAACLSVYLWKAILVPSSFWQLWLRLL